MSNNYKVNRQEFLSTFFPDKENKFQWVEVNGFILVKSYDGGSKTWRFSIFSKQSWENMRGKSNLL